MTDEDIIRKLHKMFGVGTIISEKRDGKKRSHHKLIWHWTVRKAAEVNALIPAIQPWLGQRRSQEAAASLVVARDVLTRALNKAKV